MYVYVIEADGVCKVGLSKDPEKRVRSLRTGSFAEIRLARVFDPGRKDAFAVEWSAHKLLATRFERRREWFRAPAEDCCQAVEEAILTAPDDPFNRRHNSVSAPCAPISPDREQAVRIILLLEAAARLRQKPGRQLRIGRTAQATYDAAVRIRDGA